LHHRHPPKPSHNNLPRHPAPGGPSTPRVRPSKPSNKVPNRPAPSSDEPERKSRFAAFRERFKEKPATPEEVEQLRLQAEKEKYKYNKKYYRHGQRELGGQMFRQNPPRQQSRSAPRGNGFGFGNSLLDSRPTSSGPIFGGLDSAFGSQSSRPPTKSRGRPKVEPQRGFGSGLSSMFGI